MKQFKLLVSSKQRILSVLTVATLLIGIGCGRKSENSEKPADSMMAPASMTESAPPAGREDDEKSGAKLRSAESAASSSAAQVSKDSTKKFIRTADLRFKVKHAIEATYEIENIVSRHNGYVSFTNLESFIDNKTVIPVSEDSSLSTTFYTLKNAMTLRVPDTELDTTLKEIAPLIDFLDHRIIKAEDVSLQLLSNKVGAERLGNSAQRLTNDIDKHGKKLGDVTDAEDQLLERQQQADNARISNLSLLDRVKYSTIQLSIYQRQEIRRELLPNDKNIEAFRPGIGSQLWEAVQFGWRIFEAILIAITKLWGVLLIAAVIIILFRLYRRKQVVTVKEEEQEKKS